MSRTILLFLLFSPFSAIAESKRAPSHLAVPVGKSLSTIAFGSCNHQNAKQPLWSTISKNTPDLFIWLGDIVYADTDKAEKMYQAYALQKANPSYATFIQKIPVIGIWDDHDYGKNDGGKEWHFKKESKKQLLDFLDIPDDAEVRKREGLYQAFTVGTDQQKVKIILLDTRYFRDPRNKENPSGDILGEEQWRWLEHELSASDISLFIIGSSIQVVPTEHRFEKWQNFPQSRERLLSLMPSNSILLSGDRHIGEISQVSIGEKTFTDVTSSGLTHAYEKLKNEPNQYRKGNFVNKKNFGLIRINWGGKEATIQLKGEENQVFEEVSVQF